MNTRPLYEMIKDKPEILRQIPEDRRFYDQGIQYAQQHNCLGSGACTQDFLDGYRDQKTCTKA